MVSAQGCLKGGALVVQSLSLLGWPFQTPEKRFANKILLRTLTPNTAKHIEYLKGLPRS